MERNRPLLPRWGQAGARVTTRLGVLLFVLLSVACSGVRIGAQRDVALDGPLPALPNGRHLSVLVLGDWGTGGEGQRALADTMARVHAAAPPDLVVTVGDNFYPNGVVGTRDPLWVEAFESVYRGGFWDTVPFYPTLGNHDRRGSPEAQVEYSNVSSRWKMPALYYALDEDVEGVGLVRLFALDTDPIDDEADDAPAQLDWLAGEISSPAAWRIVFGHHPFLSSSFHGGSDDMIESALPVMGGKVDLYLAGHDHITEMVLVNTLPQGVCGGGAGSDKPYGLQPGSGSLYGFTGGGWCFVRIYRNTITVDLIDPLGRVRYRHFVRKQG